MKKSILATTLLTAFVAIAGMGTQASAAAPIVVGVAPSSHVYILDSGNRGYELLNPAYATRYNIVMLKRNTAGHVVGLDSTGRAYFVPSVDLIHHYGAVNTHLGPVLAHKHLVIAGHPEARPQKAGKMVGCGFSGGC